MHDIIEAHQVADDPSGCAVISTATRVASRWTRSYREIWTAETICMAAYRWTSKVRRARDRESANLNIGRPMRI